DPSIPLKAQAPNIVGAFQVGRDNAQQDQMNQVKMAQGDIETRIQKIDLAAKKTERALQLASMATPENYAQIRNQAIQELGPEVANNIPPVYDPDFLRQQQMAGMSMIDRLKVAREEALNEARIATEGARAGSY